MTYTIVVLVFAAWLLLVHYAKKLLLIYLGKKRPLKVPIPLHSSVLIRSSLNRFFTNPFRVDRARVLVLLSSALTFLRE
jgi:hypothetical protein